MKWCNASSTVVWSWLICYQICCFTLKHCPMSFHTVTIQCLFSYLSISLRWIDNHPSDFPCLSNFQPDTVLHPYIRASRSERVFRGKWPPSEHDLEIVQILSTWSVRIGHTKKAECPEQRPNAYVSSQLKEDVGGQILTYNKRFYALERFVFI